jgi:regulator of nucleoside diphosphate kinase
MTTITLADFNLSPDIILSQGEHRALLLLALAGTGHTPDDSDDLLYELERAIVVADSFVPPDIVRMGSRVTYRTASDTRTVEIVYPAEADIAKGRISVLTPVGTALIGLRTGQSITWRTRDDRRQALTVVCVHQPPFDSDPAATA